MSAKPEQRHRPDAWATVTVLTAGSIVAVVLFAAGFLLRLAGQTSLSDSVSTFAVVVLLATPAAALMTTTVELRRVQRSAAILAILVLVILGGATVLALIGR